MKNKILHKNEIWSIKSKGIYFGEKQLALSDLLNQVLVRVQRWFILLSQSTELLKQWQVDKDDMSLLWPEIQPEG